ncbi:MAG: acetate/propionate family kinase, partial [Lactobacillus sp.]|nr:acetate/propionate family kinase [Lactobacillus sp.]
MKILVLNCGSSSLKYQLIDMDTEQVLAKGLCERIGLNNSRVTHKIFDGNSFEKEISLQNHLDAVQIVMDNLLDENYGVLQNITEIDAVGHRVLHGGKFFNKPVIVDSEVKNAIRECFILGPLHNPQNLMGIEACEKLMPGTKQVAVFDTAFHQTMSTKAFLYALPYEYFERYQIRRYGFHGTSHQYVSMRATKMLDNSNLKIITCHLGNGSSICAVENGKCIDTSMGFTPLEGLAMGTRCGDIDPAIIK